MRNLPLALAFNARVGSRKFQLLSGKEIGFTQKRADLETISVGMDGCFRHYSRELMQTSEAEFDLLKSAPHPFELHHKCCDFLKHALSR